MFRHQPARCGSAIHFLPAVQKTPLLHCAPQTVDNMARQAASPLGLAAKSTGYFSQTHLHKNALYHNQKAAPSRAGYFPV